MKHHSEVDSTHTLSGLPLPSGWSLLEQRSDEEGVYMKFWQRTSGRAITVMEGVGIKEDGKEWLHISVATPKRHVLPSWDELMLIRRLFIGEERECYMIFPPKARYVSIAEVMHLHCCLDAPGGVLPPMEGELAARTLTPQAREFLRQAGALKPGQEEVRSI